jgi:DNA-binding beta-propeller fold protein YncE
VLTFDSVGNVYISDSFNGAIWRTGPTGGAAAIWKADPRLVPNGVPPFGANGLAFNRAGDAMFVCNTANDTVVRIAVSGGVAGAATTFVNSVYDCDGLIIDEDDNLWLAANQGDEIVVVNPQGRAIAKLGDFEGLDPQGAARGLLFPASLVRSGGFIYVTNLALDFRGFNPEFNTGDSQWTAEVKRHTVAKIPARIPPIQGLK